MHVNARLWAVRVALLFASYYVSGHIGLAVPQVADHVTLFWPPAGIALAGLLRFGIGVWPGVFAGAFGVSMATGSSPGLALMIAVGNTLGPALATLLLSRDGLHTDLDRRRDVMLYAVIGVGFGMLVTATNGAFWLAAVDRIAWAEVPRTWAHWWLGDALSALVVGVPLLTCNRAAWRQATAQWGWLPSTMLLLGIVGSAALALALSTRELASLSPLLFLPHLLLCWLAMRSGLFAASASALVLTVLAIVATLHGIGPFQLPGLGGSDVFLIGYAGSLLAIPLLVTALTGENAANERRWQLALDTSQIGVGEWDLLRGRVDFSPRWLGLLGHSSQEFGHDLQAFWSRVHGDDLASVQCAFEPLRSPLGVNCRAECRMLCRDGTWRPFELHALVTERKP